MKYQLIKPMIGVFGELEQVLHNRGIPAQEWHHYLNTTDDDINSPLLFGEGLLKEAVHILLQTISDDKRVIVIVDADCDGFTSSALLINYLHDLFPAWVESRLDWFIHSGKEHGLSDCYERIINNNYSLAIVPDAGSNDFKEHKSLKEVGITTIVLDHHEVDIKPEEYKNAIIINNQCSFYPNKDFSGVGVTWQFCRYIDSLLGKNYSDEYVDLVALGNIADMVSLTSIETHHVVEKGLKNIKNPFFAYMVEKNHFSIGDIVTPIGVAWYVAPYVNAMVRSGTQEDKEILFKAMLKHYAYTEILSNKRGHRLGEMEQLLLQAGRAVSNTKNHQKKSEDEGMLLLEDKIKKEDLLKNKVILFKLKPNQIDKNIAGLCANKIMSKYQRPVCVLTMCNDSNGETCYRGSARGCEKVGLLNFKDICEETGVTEYASGHQSAFGLSIPEERIEDFLSQTNFVLHDLSNEAMYYVDFIFKDTIDSNVIFTLAHYKNLWGQGMSEPLIAIENISLHDNKIQLLGVEKGKPTLKITLDNGVNMIKFNFTQEEYEALTKGIESRDIRVNLIGTCDINEWNGAEYPQIMIKDIEVAENTAYIF